MNSSVLFAVFSLFLISCEHTQRTFNSDSLSVANAKADEITWQDDGTYGGIKMFGPIPKGFKKEKVKNKALSRFMKANYEQFDLAWVETTKNKEQENMVCKISLNKTFRTEGEANVFFRKVRSTLYEKFKTYPMYSTDTYAGYVFVPRDRWISDYAEEETRNRKSMGRYYSSSAISISSKKSISDILTRVNAVLIFDQVRRIYHVGVEYKTLLSDEADAQDHKAEKDALKL